MALIRESIQIRNARPDDAPLIVDFMVQLGVYQNMKQSITALPENMKRILEEKKGEAIFGYLGDDVVAFAYFYSNSSAFIGETGIYIDGFFVKDSVRHCGIGKQMISHICKQAQERGCKRIEWGCLDWNTSAIKFYKNLGAKVVSGMHIYRFDEDSIVRNGEMSYE